MLKNVSHRCIWISLKLENESVFLYSKRKIYCILNLNSRHSKNRAILCVGNFRSIDVLLLWAVYTIHITQPWYSRNPRPFYSFDLKRRNKTAQFYGYLCINYCNGSCLQMQMMENYVKVRSWKRTKMRPIFILRFWNSQQYCTWHRKEKESEQPRLYSTVCVWSHETNLNYFTVKNLKQEYWPQVPILPFEKKSLGLGKEVQ